MVKINPLILSISLHNDTRALQNTAGEGGEGREGGARKMANVGFHIGLHKCGNQRAFVISSP